MHSYSASHLYHGCARKNLALFLCFREKSYLYIKPIYHALILHFIFYSSCHSLWLVFTFVSPKARVTSLFSTQNNSTYHEASLT